MPSGTPIAMEAIGAATTSTSVSTVCFHRPWLMMKSRPMKHADGERAGALQIPGEQRDQRDQQHRRQQEQRVDQPVEEEVQAVGEAAEEGVEIVGQEVEERLAPGADRDFAGWPAISKSDPSSPLSAASSGNDPRGRPILSQEMKRAAAF